MSYQYIGGTDTTAAGFRKTNENFQQIQNEFESKAAKEHTHKPNEVGAINPNLLDNWYFGNPVNQRGLTQLTSSGYMIDRWKGAVNANSGDLIELISTGIKITSNTSTGAPGLTQIIENAKALSGKTVVFSINIVDAGGTGIANKGFISFNINGTANYLYVTTAGLYTQVLTMPDEVTSFTVGFSCYQNNYITVEAVKIELGDVQTLAHQDANGNWVLNEIPNYAEELAKCQRYYQRFGQSFWFTAKDTASGFIAGRFSVPMRTTPAVNIIKTSTIFRGMGVNTSVNASGLADGGDKKLTANGITYYKLTSTATSFVSAFMYTLDDDILELIAEL